MRYWNAKYSPVRVRTEARFTAADPWNGSVVTEWSVEGFVDSLKGGPLPANKAGKPAQSYGLRSEIDGVVRMLPDALGHLVRWRDVPLPELPRLLAEIAPQVEKSDFQPMLHFDLRRRLAILAGCFAAVFLLSLPFLFVARGESSFGSPGHFPFNMGAAGLLTLAVLWPVFLRRLRRRERQRAWAIERAGGRSG